MYAVACVEMSPPLFEWGLRCLPTRHGRIEITSTGRRVVEVSLDVEAIYIVSSCPS